MDGVLEVGGVGDVGLVGRIRDRLVALDLGLERLLLALGVVGLLGQRPVQGDGAVGQVRASVRGEPDGRRWRLFII